MKKIILQGKIMSILDKQITHDVKILKHNTLIEAEYDLSPVPNNLMTLAITKARDSDLPTKFWNGEVIISADEYAKIHNIDIRTAYKDLKRAVLELEKVTLRCDAFYDLNRTASMLPEQLADVAMNSDRYYSNVIIGSKPKHGNFMKMKLHIQLVNRVGYSEEGSFIYFQFSDDVLHLIETGNLDYTMYDYKNTVDLTTTPTKRLYELACKWVKIGNCKKSVDDWRHFFGLDDKYEKIAEFKRWVLIPAIKQINAQGEFELSIEQQKLGKVITHLILKIKDKRQKPAINRENFKRTPSANREPPQRLEKSHELQNDDRGRNGLSTGDNTRTRDIQSLFSQDCTQPTRRNSRDTAEHRDDFPTSPSLRQSDDYAKQRQINLDNSQEPQEIRSREARKQRQTHPKTGIIDHAKRLYERLQQFGDRLRATVKRVTGDNHEAERANKAIDCGQSQFDRTEREIKQREQGTGEHQRQTELFTQNNIREIQTQIDKATGKGVMQR